MACCCAFDLVALTSLAAAPGELKGVAHHALDADAREDRRLHRHLDWQADVGPAADAGVLALGVLADDDEVDVARLLPGQRALDPRQEDAGAVAHVLLEALADRQAQAAQRDVIGDGRKADRAEEDGVERAQHVEPVPGHHLAVPEVVLAAPREALVLQPERGGDLPRRVEHADGFGDDLVSYAVTGDDGDGVVAHVTAVSPQNRVGLCGFLRDRTLQVPVEGDESRLQLPVGQLFAPEALLRPREGQSKALALAIVILQLGPEALDLTPELGTRLFDDAVQLAAEPGEGRVRAFLVAVGGGDRLLGPVDGILFSGHPLLLSSQPAHGQLALHGKDGQPVERLPEEPQLHDERVTRGAVGGGRRLGATVRRSDRHRRHHDERKRHLSHQPLRCPEEYY